MTDDSRRGAVLVAGSANIDFVVRVPHLPAPGETVLGGDLLMVSGGKGANQAVASARAGGAATSFLAALGDDAFAPILQASLEAAGVETLIVRSERPTGAALITTSDDAENAIAVAPGANATLAPGDLPDLAGVAWLVLQLETPLPTVIAFAQAARVAGVSVMLNAAPAQPLPAELLATTDLLVVNEDELAAVTGHAGTIAERLAATGVACVVATLGSRGCCALVDGSFVLQSAFAVKAIDTTAAGDTFCGTLAAALAGGVAFADALRAGAAAGALATTLPGAQSAVPQHAQVQALLAGDSDRQRGSTALATYCGVPAPFS